MSSYALYRQPRSRQCFRVESSDGSVLSLSSLSELSGRSGFVVAPFQADNRQPILLILPDKITRTDLDDRPFTPPGVGSLADRQADYAADFARFHEQLAAGRFSKIVLARRASLSTAGSVGPEDLFFEACRRYPRLFIALVAMPDDTFWLAATPEILLEGEAGTWRTIALAGTMQLQGDELSGEGEGARWSPKNIQEQRYVANYIGDCLKRLGISYREEGPTTVRAANLVHLRSDFTFSMDSRLVGSLLSELHPTPAVCGLPKGETLDFILRHEHARREYYSGFMGPLALSGSTHLYVSLRSMHICGDEYHLFAGGGLLKDSLLAQEWQETEAKMMTMLSLLGATN